MWLENYDYTMTVNQSNVISQDAYCIDPSDELTLKQKRLITIMVSRINKKDMEFKYETFSFVEYCRYFDLADPYSGGTKKALETNIKELYNKKISLYSKSENLCNKNKYRWISEAFIDWENRTITLKLHDDLKQFYINLPDERKTIYQIGFTMKFTGKYTYKVYEYARSFLNQRLVSMEISKAFCVFGSNKYKKYSDLERRVLKPAINDINEFSDIKVYYKPLRNRKKISHIRFCIVPKIGIELEMAKEWLEETTQKKEFTETIREQFKEEIFWEEEVLPRVMEEYEDKRKRRLQCANKNEQQINLYEKKKLIDEQEEFEADNPEDSVVYDKDIEQWRDLM